MAYGTVKYTEPGTGTPVVFDDDGSGNKTQGVKLIDATAGSAAETGVSGNPLHVQGAQIGIVTETVPASDTASSGLNGRLQRIAQRLSSIIALLPAALGAQGGLKIEGVASGTAVPVSGSVTSAASGGVAHDGVDSGNPVKVGYRAIPYSAQTPVAEGDRSDALCDRHGIPFHIGGHPDAITFEYATTGAQTDVSLVGTINAGTKVVVTQIQILADNANTAFPQVRVGFGVTNTPTTTGVVASHPGLPAGGGLSRGDGSGILGAGADGEELRITCGAPTGGSIRVVCTYFTIPS